MNAKADPLWVVPDGSKAESGRSTTPPALFSLPRACKSPQKPFSQRRQRRDRQHEAKAETVEADCGSDGTSNQVTHSSRTAQHCDASAQKTHEGGGLEVIANKIRSVTDTESTHLPPLAVKPAARARQQHNVLPIRRNTWGGSLEMLQELCSDSSRSNNAQEGATDADSTLAAFQATETILVAEIDSDEHCASFLRLRAPRMTLTAENLDWHRRSGPQSQVQYKLRALERKIHMNREKLTQVRERILQLGGKPACLSALLAQETEHEQPKHTEPQIQASISSETRELDCQKYQEKTESLLSPANAAATIVQRAFRGFQARCLLASLARQTYQRVLDPRSNQFFYYNRRTRLSRWEVEAPALLRHSLANNSRHAVRRSSDLVANAAARKLQSLVRRRAARIFLQDLARGHLEKVFDAGFGAWYYFNARTQRSFWETLHHVQLTTASGAIYHRHGQL